MVRRYPPSSAETTSKCAILLMRPKHLPQSGAVDAILSRESRPSPMVASVPDGLSRMGVWRNQTELVLRRGTLIVSQGVRALKTASNSAKDELSLLTFRAHRRALPGIQQKVRDILCVEITPHRSIRWASLTQVSMPPLQAANIAASLSRTGGLEADISSERLPIIQPAS
jgi:hypothetical protein